MLLADFSDIDNFEVIPNCVGHIESDSGGSCKSKTFVRLDRERLSHRVFVLLLSCDELWRRTLFVEDCVVLYLGEFQPSFGYSSATVAVDWSIRRN